MATFSGDVQYTQVMGHLPTPIGILDFSLSSWVKSPFCLGKSRPKPAFYEELQQGGYLKATTGWTPDWVKMVWTYLIVNTQKIEKHRTVIHHYNYCNIYIYIYYRYVIFVLYQFIF